jgi:hypothetical protein
MAQTYEQTVYEQNGYDNRANYLQNLVEEYDVDFEQVQALADVLGPDEDFDGLVNAVQDLESEGDFE